MRRRELIAIIGGAVAAWPLRARAQPKKIPRVGIITPASNADAPMMRVLRDSFRDLGYVDGQTIILDFAFAEGDLARVPTLVAGLVSRRADVIVVDGGNLTAVVAAATTTIPVVAAVFARPVESGLVKSLAHPGGNLTGFVLTVVETNAKRLEILKAAFPKVRKVALLWGKGGEASYVGAVEQAALTLKIEVRRFQVDDPTDLARSFQAAAANGTDALITLPDGIFFNHRQEMVALAAASKLPAMFPEREYVEAGGLMSYGTLVAENFRRAVDYVDRILKGAKPGDLPVQEPTKYELVLNLKTARALRSPVPTR
jgi:putative tryptophan/tyrosine transport system substrate-binding protein